MIRLATLSDVPAINTIYNQAVKARFQTASLEPLSRDQHLEWFRNVEIERYPVFVMEKEREIVGYYTLSPYRRGREALKRVAEISYYLHTGFQRQGFGSILLEHGIHTAPKYGFSDLVAVLLSRNTGSIRLLEKFGFAKWGCLPQVARIGNEICDHLYYGMKLKTAL